MPCPAFYYLARQVGVEARASHSIRRSRSSTLASMKVPVETEAERTLKEYIGLFHRHEHGTLKPTNAVGLMRFTADDDGGGALSKTSKVCTRNEAVTGTSSTLFERAWCHSLLSFLPAMQRRSRANYFFWGTPSFSALPAPPCFELSPLGYRAISHRV